MVLREKAKQIKNRIKKEVFLRTAPRQDLVAAYIDNRITVAEYQDAIDRHLEPSHR